MDICNSKNGINTANPSVLALGLVGRPLQQVKPSLAKSGMAKAVRRHRQGGPE